MSLDIIPNSVVLYHDMDFSGNPRKGTLIISLYGKIYCGTPNFIDDYREAFLEIPQSMLGQGDFFALRAKGDSMIGAGINDGDILIIKMQDYAVNGQIVVARLDQDVTLKRYFFVEEQKKYILHPENEDYEDIVTTTCNIMGIAVKIIKNIEEV